MYNIVRILDFGRNKNETTGEETSFNNKCSVIGSSISAYAHPGRTDANGDIRVVQIVKNGDCSTGNIIITINQLLVVVQRARLLARIIIVL